MSDLISRQSVIDLLKKSASRDIEEVVITEKHINLIKDMPVAYDVNEVVASLGAMRGKACFGVDCEKCVYTLRCAEGECSENVAIDKAIAIVKAGGVE